ncbi:MAG: FtsX-like permease family protein, partial [Phycisphaerae bacterium]|nr:FtsX-like permease family protein [Phycisphaerae bacterium]
GLLKSLGASNLGVAGIFLAYGAVVGLIGSLAGVVGGYFFVLNINSVHKWTRDTFGFSPWNKDSYMFESIPNEVDWTAVVYIVIGAIVTGLVGTLLPAIRAARMQPVEALRYE